MRILITTGLDQSQVGGPAQYGPRLKEEFEKLGHSVKLAQYGAIESALLRVWPRVLWADCVLALDTFSVGVPAVLASWLLDKRVIVRVGGDFLGESYVERTGEKITLKQFNENIPELKIKEKLIRYFTKVLTNLADKLVFNTEWQREMWQKSYNIPTSKSHVVKNYIP